MKKAGGEVKFIPLTPDNEDAIMNEYLKRNYQGSTNEAEIEQFRKYLRRGFKLLTERQQQIVKMHYENNMNQKEIAEALGTSQQNISKHLKYAIKKVQGYITISLHFQNKQPS